MLLHMTKKTFIEGINENRFVVQNVKSNKFSVMMMDTRPNPRTEGGVLYSINHVINPDTKDGLFNQSGGGYNKAHACIEEIARYVDQNAEDKDEGDTTCAAYFMRNQHVNTLS